MLTFKQFQATGHNSDDVGTEIDNDFGSAIAGRVYGGKLYIMRGTEDGSWVVPLDGPSEFVGNLVKCEHALYDWAVGEGYVDHQLNILEVAVMADTLDLALGAIMDALNIPDGGVAGHVFDTVTPETWTDWEPTNRATNLAAWLRAELAQATP